MSMNAVGHFVGAPCSAKVAVAADPESDPMLRLAARRLAAELDLPVFELDRVSPDMLLLVQGDGLSLQWVGEAADAPGPKLGAVRIELSTIDASSGQGRSLRQPLAKAVGLRRGEPYRPSVLDATAGFGEDAWLLAQLGCVVTACERCAVMAALLGDALRRAGMIHSEAAGRIRACHGDAAEVLRNGSVQPEVVYLDPMFPARRKAARQRKNMWMLHQLVGEDVDSAAVLEAALQRASRRVVVKRPLRAQPLAGRPPAATHEGRAHRFDVYPTR